MGKKIVLGIVIIFLLVIAGEVAYLLYIRSKPGSTPVSQSQTSKTEVTQETASTPFKETPQDTLRVNKILGIYLSSASPLFANGEVRTTLRGYVVSPPQIDSDSITFQMNINQNGNENSTIKAYFENTKFLNESSQPVDYHSIEQGDHMSVVYIYNYKLDQYFTEVVLEAV